MRARPRIAVLALGASNKANICSGLERAGATAYSVRNARDFDGADALVIPGVANVAFLIDALDAARLRKPLLAAIVGGIPTLGVCAGFQLCFEGSDEAPTRDGLGLFAGRVRALRAPKIPHMGWNWVQAISPEVPEGWAYFAHSFAAPADVGNALAVTIHGEAFASVCRLRNVLGLQFHPERSGAYGASLLAAFVGETAARC